MQTITIPSSTHPGVVHTVHVGAFSASCDCRGFRFRGTCRHITAARGQAAPVTAEQASAEAFTVFAGRS